MEVGAQGRWSAGEEVYLAVAVHRRPADGEGEPGSGRVDILLEAAGLAIAEGTDQGRGPVQDEVRGGDAARGMGRPPGDREDGGCGAENLGDEEVFPAEKGEETCR